MASWITYKGLTIPDASSGDAGENLTDNFKLLADNFDALDAGDVTTGTLAVARGGTGTGTAFTTGSVIFAGASGVYSQNNSSLYWDNTNKRFGVGLASPADSIVNIASNLGDSAYSGRSGSLRVTAAGNAVLWGHTNTEYLCAIGAKNGGGEPFIDFFCYHGPYTTGTPATWNRTYRTSATLLPAQFIYSTTGTLSLLTAPAGTANAEITDFSTRLSISNAGQLQLGRGTASAPIYCFLSDTGTGIWSPGANTVSLSTAGSERLRVDSSGRLGIANTSPSAQLDVSAGSSSTVGALIKGAASQTANLQEWQNSSGNVLVQIDANGGAVFNEQGSSSADFRVEGDTNANLLVVDASADAIGIGTNAPSSKALMEFSSTTQGVLLPRMTTTQRNAITSPPAGLLIYNTTTNKLNFYAGSAWQAVTSA